MTGCKTVNGLKEDVYDARKSVSDFVSPSEPPVKEKENSDNPIEIMIKIIKKGVSLEVYLGGLLDLWCVLITHH